MVGPWVIPHKIIGEAHTGWAWETQDGDSGSHRGWGGMVIIPEFDKYQLCPGCVVNFKYFEIARQGDGLGGYVGRLSYVPPIIIEKV